MIRCCSGISAFSTCALKLALVGKCYFHFSHVLGNVVDYVNTNPSAYVKRDHGLLLGRTVRVRTKTFNLGKKKPPISRQKIQLLIVSRRIIPFI